jgi:hypothetical protein
MELKPVHGYQGTQYPCLEDFFADTEEGWAVRAAKLTIAMSMLALLLGGCSSFG